MTEPGEHTARGGSNRRSGFTLIELMVGIAVSSVLVLGLFQLLSDLSLLQNKYKTTSVRDHRRAAIMRIMDQDLTSIPSSKPEFIGRSREFYRTTVAFSPERGLRLETRIHYYLRTRDESTQLIREARWVDMQEDYGQPRVLLRAPSIRFHYRTANSGTVRSTTSNQTVTAVRIELENSSLSMPLGRRPDSSKSETGSSPVRTRR